VELVQTRGFNSFSYQDISDRLRIRKASIHYHFPSKESLGSTLLETYTEGFREWARPLLQQELSATELMQSYFDLFLSISDGCNRICPFGAFASEWSALPVRLKKEVTALFETQRDWIREVIRKGRASGEFASNGTPEEQAQFLFASIQGAMQTARVQDNPAQFRAITRQLLSALKGG
jgi:TetR/AcrR family transcriptional repressor of nem operon